MVICSIASCLSFGKSPAVVLAEIFPAKLRCTCHGISAASGKEGAVVVAFGSLYAVDGIGAREILKILGVVNFLGLMFTFLVLESKGKSLEELPGEAEQENGSTAESRQTVSVQLGFLFM
jgi:PHS family inorganic phosphate transporter-like MFS transporter